MLNAFGIEHTDPVSKALEGSMLSNFEQRVKRDAGGRFSTVEEGKKAAATVNQAVHRGAGKVSAPLQQQQGTVRQVGEKIEDHPYISLVVAGAATKFGARKALDAFAKGRLVFAKADDISRVADSVRPTRTYGAADQVTGMGDISENLTANPGDIPRAMAHGIKYKFTGKQQMPRAEYYGDNVRGTNVLGRQFGANNSPITDLNDLMESGTRPYSRPALRMMQGNSTDDTLRTVEKRIKGNNHESSFVVVNGELVSGMSGSWMMTGYVIPQELKLSGKVVNFTHNHPAIMKKQARSFSPGDFQVLEQIIRNGASKKSTLRAVYGDGTVQEIVITDWAKFRRFNRVVSDAITTRASREGLKENELEPLLEAQAMIQAAATKGNHGFKIVEHSDFAKADKPLTPTQIKNKKRTQSRISQATGALGLAALGGTALATKPGQAALRGGFKRVKRPVPDALKAKPKEKGIDSTVTPLLATSAGLGAAGSFNFAQYTRAEADKGKRVKKNETGPSPFEDGFYGTTTEISKGVGDWKTIDQREQTQRRDRKVMRNSAAAAGAGAGLVALGLENDAPKYKAVGNAIKRVEAGRKVGEWSNKDAAKTAGKIAAVGAKDLSRSGKLGLGLIGAGAAAGSAAKGQHTYQQHKINQRRRKNFKKSLGESAFGVVHD